MTTQNQTLNLYLEADESQRLGMYLFYRDLRGEFAKIEMAEAEDAEDHKGSQPSESGLKQLVKNLMEMIRMRKYPTLGEKRSTT